MGTFSAKMTLKDRYWFGGFSGTPPSEPNLSTPPPPPGSQFGFRKKFSTDFAITKLLDKVIQSLSNKEHVNALFMDLSKAFDTIDHDILLYKLNNYGIRGIVLSWLKM